MGFLTTFSDSGSRTYKDAARTATTGPIDLSSAPASIGSVPLNLNDRVLVKDQLNGADNGIYLFKGVGLPMVRSTDANTSREVLPNMLLSVSEGDYADKVFELTTDGPIVLGTTPLVFGLAILPIDLSTDVVGVLPVANGGTNRSSWTEGRIPFVGASGLALAEDSELNWIDSTNRLGIGTSTPNAKVQINNSGSQLGLSVYSTSSNNTAEFYNQGTTNYTLALNSAADSAQTGASIGGYFARGTLSSRQQTLANDVLLSITASGHTGSSVAAFSGGMVIAADQNTEAAAFGGQVLILTTPNSTLSLPLPRLVVKNDGKVGIGTLLPSEQLEVSGNAKANNFYSGLGSVSAPSYTFSGDLNTGVYSSGPDVVNITTGGNERLRINSTGQVYIPNLTASELIATDASQNLQSLSTVTYPSLTELSYVKGTTSSIQTQLDTKENKASVTRITKTANYAVATTDDYIGCDSTGGAFTLTLPDASTAYSGKRLIIKDEGGDSTSNNIIINAAGGQFIDGSSSYTLNSNYESATLICNGADEWFII